MTVKHVHVLKTQNIQVTRLTCITLNIRGIRDASKRASVIEWAKQQKIDILMLQETHVTQDIEQVVNRDWSGKCFHSFGERNARGVSIFVKQNDNVKITETYKDTEGRKLAIKIEIDDREFLLTCIFAPTHDKSKEQCSFFRSVRNWLMGKISPATPLIIGGDLNVTFNADVDRTGVSRINQKAVKAAEQMCKSLQVVDLWRAKNPSCKQFTYRTKTMSSRIDYMLVSKHLADHANCDIRPAVKADHNAVYVKLCMPNSTRGRGYWKMNTQLLVDPMYKAMISDVMEETKQETIGICYRKTWDLCKKRIKEASIEYSTNLARLKRFDFEVLQKEVNDLDRVLAEDKSPENLAKLNAAKERLDMFCTERARGAQIRSRVQWYEDGERNTKYFLNMERKRVSDNNVSKLTLPNGTQVSNPTEILQEEVRFYRHLYSSRKVSDEHIRTYLDSIEVGTVLSVEEQQELEGKLTEEECRDALKKMKSNKSPGLDGLPTDFYKAFWDIIGDTVLNALNESYDKGELSVTQKTAVLTLIHKKGDRTNLGNWRPISLLNSDYKLAAHVLANRLHRVLNSIIHTDQTGYIKGRFIGNNIRLINDIIDSAETNQTGGSILF